jgi:two-component system, chemotaxis family, CheB/CheR fusion protein
LIAEACAARSTISFRSLADDQHDGAIGIILSGTGTEGTLGCATGEEAYSIAILATEQVAAARSACRVQVFATDIDDDALEIARGGVYPESIALDLTPQRLKRFFTRDDHRYTIVKSIRESVVFAVQNVISDPPFSKMDFVSCRNVLIYLESSVQERVMAVFHFALNPGGYLFLGNAESIGHHEEWFSLVSK